MMLVLSWGYFYGEFKLNPEGSVVATWRVYLESGVRSDYMALVHSVLGVYVVNAIPWSIGLFAWTVKWLRRWFAVERMLKQNWAAVFTLVIVGNSGLLFVFLFNSLLPVIISWQTGDYAAMLLNDDVYVTGGVGGLIILIIDLIGLVAFNLACVSWILPFKPWQRVVWNGLGGLYLGLIGFILLF
jgi:hypothetical protein